MNDYKAEEEVLGVDHAEIGGVLAEKWNFDKEIIHCIQYHHSLLQSRASLATAIVSLSNLFAKKAGLCFPWDEKAFDIKSSAAWEMQAEQSRQQIDIDQIIMTLAEESSAVKEAVAELLLPA